MGPPALKTMIWDEMTNACVAIEKTCPRIQEWKQCTVARADVSI
jgi:hypothetical protein